MKKLQSFIGLAIALSAFAQAENQNLIYSPNKAFVVAWFDTELGEPIGSARSIVLSELPAGNKPFSIVTVPRHTLAAWSSDSKRCVIINAPDNGNTNTWLFTAKKEGPQRDAIPIYPLRPLERTYYRHWDEHQLWRPGISEVVWKDNHTIVFSAADNRGEYKITLQINDLDHPSIDPIPQQRTE